MSRIFLSISATVEMNTNLDPVGTAVPGEIPGETGHCKRYRATGPESTTWLLPLTGTVGGDESANNRASNVIAWPCEMCGVRGRELGELNV